MTIITKIKEGKSEPLVGENGVKTVSVDIKPGSDDSNNRVRRSAHIFGTSLLYTLYALIAMLIVLLIAYVYLTFCVAYNGSTDMDTFNGWAEIPLPQSSQRVTEKNYDDDDEISELMSESMTSFLNDLLKEHLEIDLREESYEKITVPDFQGMQGRFIHDFSFNVTGIIDPRKGRCFILPLNRSAILPPKSLFDVIHKMRDGYYDINMTVIKQNYVAVRPAIYDFSTLGPYIAGECQLRPTYRLEKIDRRVSKRSANENTATFAQFAGKSFQEFVITNIDDIEEFEKQH